MRDQDRVISLWATVPGERTEVSTSLERVKRFRRATRTLVGIAGCHRDRGAKQRHIAHIWGVYVIPERRGTGLGRKIFVAAVERARAWPDLEQLWLDVTTVNKGARALYASCGFTRIAIKPRVLKVGDSYYDEELMALNLKPS